MGTDVSANGQDSVKVFDSAPTEGVNAHYVGNRAPLLPSSLVKLPVGSIEAQGWVREQLVLMAEGMPGKLPEISQWCRFEGSAWTSADGKGEHPWEEMPYWL
jgi:hypothetical protein